LLVSCKERPDSAFVMEKVGGVACLALLRGAPQSKLRHAGRRGPLLEDGICSGWIWCFSWRPRGRSAAGVPAAAGEPHLQLADLGLVDVARFELIAA
jgi:hypothetical protein